MFANLILRTYPEALFVSFYKYLWIPLKFYIMHFIFRNDYHFQHSSEYNHSIRHLFVEY